MRAPIGLPVRVLHYGLLILLSLTIVASLKAVGIILVIAMLVAPGAIAYLLTDSFERMLVIATAVAIGVGGARHHRQLPYRRRDRRLHRADPVRGFRAGVPVRAEARTCGRTGARARVTGPGERRFTRPLGRSGLQHPRGLAHGLSRCWPSAKSSVWILIGLALGFAGHWWKSHADAYPDILDKDQSAARTSR